MEVVAILHTFCPCNEVLMLMDPVNTIVFLHLRRIMEIHDMGVETYFRNQFSTFFTIATMANFSWMAQWTGICIKFTFLFMPIKLRNTMLHPSMHFQALVRMAGEVALVTLEFKT